MWTFCTSDSVSAVKCVFMWESVTVDEQQDYAASHLPVTTSSCLVTSSLSTNTLTPQTQKWENWCKFQEIVGFDGCEFPHGCFAGQGGQCRAYRGYLEVVVAVAVCMKVRSLAFSPCPAHNAVIHTERGSQGPRTGWPFLQRWPRGRLLRPAWDWTWQLWGRLLCKLKTVYFCFLFRQLSLLILYV